MIKINKKWALFMLVINWVYLAYSVAHLLYFGTHIFVNFDQKVNYVSPVYYYAMLAFTGILNFILFIGIYWILKTYNVKKWIRVSVLILLGRTMVATVVYLGVSFIPATPVHELVFLTQFTRAINYITLFYMYFSLLFVRDRSIRIYLWGYVMLTLVAWFYPMISGNLYDEFGYAWLLINAEFLNILPLVVTLILFTEVFNRSRTLVLETSNGKPAVG